jgi:hypothetical protein
MVDGEVVPLTVILYDPVTGDTQRRYVLDEIPMDDLINGRWLADPVGGYTVVIDIRESLRR